MLLQYYTNLFTDIIAILLSNNSISLQLQYLVILSYIHYWNITLIFLTRLSPYYFLILQL